MSDKFDKINGPIEDKIFFESIEEQHANLL